MGQQELLAIRQREAARRAKASALVVPFLPVAAQDGRVEPGFRGITWDERRGVAIQWHNGRPVGAFLIPSE